MDVPNGENSYTNLTKHVPFPGDAVWLARMIDEPSQIAFIGGINHLPIWGFHQIVASRTRVLFDSHLTYFRCGGENFSNVLHDEFPSSDELTCLETPSLAPCREGVNISILMLLKLSVLTEISTITCLIIALSWNHSVQASFPTIIGHISVLWISSFKNIYFESGSRGRHKQLSISSFLGVFLLRSR